MGYDQEFEDFKTKINLTEFAASHGYLVNKLKSTASEIVMKKDSDVIVVSKGPDGHWIYYSVHDDLDRGSIIDFVIKRYEANFGKVRCLLRPWLGFQKRPKINPSSFVKKVASSDFDPQKIQRIYDMLRPLDVPLSRIIQDYLVLYRGFEANFFSHGRFHDQLKTDRYNNLIFPHFDQSSVIGWEIKNKNFTGFPKNSKKSFWITSHIRTDTKVVITESGIDALSFYALYPHRLEDTVAIATSGGWSPLTEAMLIRFLKTNRDLEKILAFDNDTAGRKFTNRTVALLEDLGQSNFIVLEIDGKDLNDQLTSSHSTIQRS